MARNRPTRAQLKYWDDVLKQHGLGMDRGRNTNKLVYVGGSKELSDLADGFGYRNNDDPEKILLAVEAVAGVEPDPA